MGAQHRDCLAPQRVLPLPNRVRALPLSKPLSCSIGNPAFRPHLAPPLSRRDTHTGPSPSLHATQPTAQPCHLWRSAPSCWLPSATWPRSGDASSHAVRGSARVHPHLSFHCPPNPPSPRAAAHTCSGLCSLRESPRPGSPGCPSPLRA